MVSYSIVCQVGNIPLVSVPVYTSQMCIIYQIKFSFNYYKLCAKCESSLFFYQSSGIAAELSGLGVSLTILVPANSAFDKIDNSTMRFLTSTDVV